MRTASGLLSLQEWKERLFAKSMGTYYVPDDILISKGCHTWPRSYNWRNYLTEHQACKQIQRPLLVFIMNCPTTKSKELMGEFFQFPKMTIPIIHSVTKEMIIGRSLESVNTLYSQHGQYIIYELAPIWLYFNRMAMMKFGGHKNQY